MQASPSLHCLPELVGFEQTPVVVLQVPTSWHWSLAVQMTGLAPTQTPAWQMSLWVQAFPSLHGVPGVLGVPAAQQRLVVMATPFAQQALVSLVWTTAQVVGL